MTTIALPVLCTGELMMYGHLAQGLIFLSNTKRLVDGQTFPRLTWPYPDSYVISIKCHELANRSSSNLAIKVFDIFYTKVHFYPNNHFWV